MKISTRLGVLAAAIAVTGTAAAAGMAAPAAAHPAASGHTAAIPRLTSYSGYLCDGYTLCATSANLNTGTNYIVSPNTPNSRYNLGGTSKCNTGYVTSGCPYIQGSNNNTADQGDQIIKFYSKVNFGKCIGANASAYMVVKDCPGGSNDYGTYWVWEGPNRFVNIAATNAADLYNTRYDMCAQQSNQSYIDAEVQSGLYCWWDLSG